MSPIHPSYLLSSGREVNLPRDLKKAAKQQSTEEWVELSTIHALCRRLEIGSEDFLANKDWCKSLFEDDFGPRDDLIDTDEEYYLPKTEDWDGRPGRKSRELFGGVITKTVHYGYEEVAKATVKGRSLKLTTMNILGITDVEFKKNDAPFEEMMERLKELNRLHKDRKRQHEARKCEREFIKKYGDLYFNIVYRRGADYCLSKGVNPTSSSPQYNMSMWVTDVGPCFYLSFIKSVRELRKWSGFILEAAKAFDRIGKRWSGRPPYPKIPDEVIIKLVEEYVKKGYPKMEACELVDIDTGGGYFRKLTSTRGTRKEEKRRYSAERIRHLYNKAKKRQGKQEK